MNKQGKTASLAAAGVVAIGGGWKLLEHSGGEVHAIHPVPVHEPIHVPKAPLSVPHTSTPESAPSFIEAVRSEDGEAEAEIAQSVLCDLLGNYINSGYPPSDDDVAVAVGNAAVGRALPQPRQQKLQSDVQTYMKSVRDGDAASVQAGQIGCTISNQRGY